jgi:serine phosphatase RsbU (regulator of sigma subunit)
VQKQRSLFAGLDQLLAGMGGPVMATAQYGILDLDTHRLELVNAGHPPPLVIPPHDPPRYLELDPGLPLGVETSAAFTTSAVDLEPGTVLLLYTDGLIESRTRSLADGLDQLRAAAATRAESLGSLIDHVVREMVPDGTGDDVAVLAVRV